MDHWPLFVCESCTVRAVLNRELGGPGDLALLRLERVRILDIANSWAENSHRTYKTYLNYMTRFEQRHPGLELVSRPEMSSPPVTGAIGLAWAELQYSLRPGNSKHRDRVAFGTVRMLRSAVAWHNTVSAVISSTGIRYEARTRRITGTHLCPTDEAMMTRFTEGMRRRLGDDPRPSYALLFRHVKAMDRFYSEKYTAAVGSERRRWALAGLANTLLWLGWLRATELMDLRWCDVTAVQPGDGAQHDLPPQAGCLLLRLSPITKTSPHRTADLPIAFRTRAGLSPGVWFNRARQACNADEASVTHIFCTSHGVRWTSEWCRTRFLYPQLRELAKAGDPYLAPFTNRNRISDLTLEQAFYSLHCYRRGARTYVEIRPEGTQHRSRPTAMHIYEHARWRKARTGEDIDVIYRQWPLWERLKVTLLWM